MARTRGKRPRGRFPRRRGFRTMRGDWVYRGDTTAVYALTPSTTQLTPALNVPRGTYSPTITTITAGPETSNVFMLYDSQSRMRHQASTFFTAANTFGYADLHGAARAEGREPLILAVEGMIYFEPTVWALGNLMAIGIRPIVLEQDPADGGVLLSPTYSMWDDGTVLQAPIGNCADWANDKMWLLDRRIHHGFSDNQTFITPHFRWKGRRRLKPNQCLALYVELEGTSVNVRMQPWLRTFVIDEG